MISTTSESFVVFFSPILVLQHLVTARNREESAAPPLIFISWCAAVYHINLLYWVSGCQIARVGQKAYFPVISECVSVVAIGLPPIQPLHSSPVSFDKNFKLSAVFRIKFHRKTGSQWRPLSCTACNHNGQELFLPVCERLRFSRLEFWNSNALCLYFPPSGLLQPPVKDWFAKCSISRATRPVLGITIAHFKKTWREIHGFFSLFSRNLSMMTFQWKVISGQIPTLHRYGWGYAPVLRSVSFNFPTSCWPFQQHKLPLLSHLKREAIKEGKCISFSEKKKTFKRTIYSQDTHFHHFAHPLHAPAACNVYLPP